jgi:hypothetical protein
MNLSWEGHQIKEFEIFYITYVFIILFIIYVLYFIIIFYITHLHFAPPQEKWHNSKIFSFRIVAIL